MTPVVDGPTATAAAADAVRQVLAGYHLPEPELRGLCATIVARVAPILHAGWDAERPAPVVLPAPSADPDGTRPVGISLKAIDDFERSVAKLKPLGDPRPTPPPPDLNGLTPVAQVMSAPSPALPVLGGVTPAGEAGRDRAVVVRVGRRTWWVIAPAVKRVRGRDRAQRYADKALARAEQARDSLVEVRHLPDLP